MESRALLRGRSVLSEKYGARNGETGNLANINVNGVGRGRKKKKKKEKEEKINFKRSGEVDGTKMCE